MVIRLSLYVVIRFSLSRYYAGIITRANACLHVQGKPKRRMVGTTAISVKLPAALVRQLDELVEEGMHISRSDAIRVAIAMYLHALRKERAKELVAAAR